MYKTLVKYCMMRAFVWKYDHLTFRRAPIAFSIILTFIVKESLEWLRINLKYQNVND